MGYYSVIFVHLATRVCLETKIKNSLLFSQTLRRFLFIHVYYSVDANPRVDEVDRL